MAPDPIRCDFDWVQTLNHHRKDLIFETHTPDPYKAYNHQSYPPQTILSLITQYSIDSS